MSDYVLLPKSMISTDGCQGYLTEEWTSKQDQSDNSDLWCAVHGALIQALEECAEYHEAKMQYHADGDGFFDYKGTIDVNVMASKIAYLVKKKLQGEAVVKAF